MTLASVLRAATAQDGAVFGEDAGWNMPLHYGDPGKEYAAAVEGAALFDISHHGKIEVVGRDAAAFLHNLCTADVKGLSPGAGCEAFLATAKAKAVAYLLLFRRPPENPPSYWLDVGPGRGSAVFQHLDHFLISEQLELSARSADLAQLHLRGRGAAALLGKVLALETLPTPMSTVTLTWQGSLVEVRRTGPIGFDVLVPTTIGEAWWQALRQAGAGAAGLETLEVLRVEAGLPKVGAELDENRSVFEVGLNQRAICYTKGCYLGQEPIVMARDRGHINRTLLGLQVDADAAVPPGAKVWRDGQEIGQVTSSVRSPSLGIIALAYLKRGHQEPGSAVEVDLGPVRAPATIQRLPFVSREP